MGGSLAEPALPADELLESYEDLVVWCVRLGVVSKADGETLTRAASRDEKRRATHAPPREAAAGARVRDLPPDSRGRRKPPADLLDRLRDAERDALSDARLAPADGAMRWTWPPPRDLADPLRPLAHSAVELLTSGPLEHLKVCGNCRWLFLDQSRNHSRRWCSMEECGKQMKQRRFVERRRAIRVGGGA